MFHTHVCARMPNNNRVMNMYKLIVSAFIFCISQAAFSQVEDSVTNVKRIILKQKIIPKIGPPMLPIRRYLPMEGVIIRAYRRSGKASMAANETVKAEDLKIRNNGQDLPMLLQHQTGIVVTSDAGNGIGYTGIRVRGSDATRTNISVNGVPINDAESQGTFWVNMPDLASSAKNVHIQRGVGSSVHGAGAFGASVLIETGGALNRSTELNMSYGSFNSRKITAKHSSGIKSLRGRKQISYDIRLSHIGSDGFIDRASTNLYGYMASVQLEGKRNWRHKLLAFGGWEKTYQAWWGIPIEKYRLGDPNKTITATDSQNLKDHYLRNIGMYRNNQDSANLFGSNPNTYNYYNYPNETDNYTQHHLHYYLMKNLSAKWEFNATAYYTFGQGYFEQFRFQDELNYYGINPIINGADTQKISNLIRQRWLQNHLIGLNLNLFHTINSSNYLQIGFGGNRYIGTHFGVVPEIGQPTNDVTRISQFNQQNPAALPVEYYTSTGNKTDLSSFLKLNHTSSIIPGFQAFADLQLRYVNHTGKGTDNDLLNIDFQGEFLFFNPKVGIHYFYDADRVKHNWDASVSMGNREPARSDFTDNKKGQIPVPERLIDYELGYSIDLKRAKFSFTGYYMDYQNQLVLTGALNDVGTPLRQNVAKSYRRGIELASTIRLFSVQKYKSLDTKHDLFLNFNAAFSQNRIQKLTANWIDYADYSSVDSVFNETPIAYSPDLVGSAGLTYRYKPGNKKQLELQLLQKYVGKQYLDNTGDDYRSIPSYTFTELNASYQHKWDGHALRFGINVQNVFNDYFVNNGYTWGYMYGSRNVVQEVFVFPSAPRNLNVNVSWIF